MFECIYPGGHFVFVLCLSVFILVVTLHLYCYCVIIIRIVICGDIVPAFTSGGVLC